MGKFGSNRNSNSRGGFGGRRGGNDDGGGESRGNYGRRSSGGGRGKRDDNSLKLGDISVSEKVADELGDQGLDELRDSSLSMYVKVYPPKGVDEVVLKRGDYLNIRICKSKHGKERTVGFVTASESE